MSVVEAVAPLRRRALERQGMTAELELDLLIREQEADDVFYISRPAKEVSLDGPAPEWGLISNFIAQVEGEIVSFLPRSNESVFLVSFKHSTFDAYNNHGCRCRRCKTFMADYRRTKRQAA